MSSTVRPYGEPRTRRRILQAAWDLLEANGSAVRIADVAEAANVSRQTIYLHFRDRAGLFIALVDDIDTSLGSAEMRAHVFGAPTGVESLRRFVETLSWYTAKIDTVSQVFESAQYRDEALRAGWRNRMDRRRDIIRTIVARIEAEGCLAEGWTADAAVDLIHAITMPGLWRELTREAGWSQERYAAHVTEMLLRSLVTEPARRA